MSRETLAGQAHFELEVRKSRFLAFATPVDTVEAAMAFIEANRVTDARHNCWAYRIGQQYRFSDDGEPGGTAGRPILAAIDGQGLDDTAVLVARYFGGIKLGAGGLVRAYGGCAAECLRTAPRRTCIDWKHGCIQLDFGHAAAVIRAIEELSGQRLDERYDANGLVLEFRIPQQNWDRLAPTVRDLSRGRSELQPLTSGPAPDLS